MSQDDSQSLLARVKTDGIVETAVKDSVDFIVRLGQLSGSRHLIRQRSRKVSQNL